MPLLRFCQGNFSNLPPHLEPDYDTFCASTLMLLGIKIWPAPSQPSAQSSLQLPLLAVLFSLCLAQGATNANAARLLLKVDANKTTLVHALLLNVREQSAADCA